jgi:Cu-processing system ATP-binding protein
VTAPILEIRGLAKSFGSCEVLRSIDLTVQPAEHLALIGNNGQGKTTLIRLILGLIRPDGGAVLLHGEPLPWPRRGADKRAIGYLPESVSFYPNLSGQRTLAFLGRLKGLRGAGLHTEAESLLERVGLSAAAGQPVRTYSKGMRQRLGLAQALLGGPRLLLLDEPTNGLDPEGIHEVYDILAALQREGVAILMASHLLAEIEPRLDRLAVLRDGVIAKVGNIAQLAAEAHLPGVIRFVLREPRQELPAELARMVAHAQTNGVSNGYLLRVEEAEKYTVLGELVRHRERMASLSVREPGLEELFQVLNPPARVGVGSVQRGDGEREDC